MKNIVTHFAILIASISLSAQVNIEVEGSTTEVDNLITAQVNYSGSQDIRAIVGHSITNPGFGIGGRLTGGYKGIDVINNGQSFNFTTYGIYSSSYGTAGTRIGLYSEASGGTNNLAAQFGAGHVEIENNLRIGVTTSGGRFHLKNQNTLFGNKATAAEIECSHNGSQVTKAININSSNSGSGATYGIFSIATNSSSSGIAHAVRADVYSPEDWAIYATGNNYFNGDVRVGTQLDPYDGIYRVIVDGRILAEEVRVQNSTAWPDYVFENDYQLLSLTELEESIKKNGHLPGIPSAKEIEDNGQHLGEVQIKMLRKIEELTLYVLQLQKEIEFLKNQ